MKKAKKGSKEGPVLNWGETAVTVSQPPYKTYRIPVAMVDWENPDQMFKPTGNDTQRAKFARLLQDYRIHSWSLDSSNIRILFELRI